MKHIRTAKIAEEWFTVVSMGTYEADYKNGELWTFNGELWYLSHLELGFKELSTVIDMTKQL